ncbi:MAG TPA: hypothetical protein DDX39_01405 [Bacteroidales bacterium]|nr:MAG: hypothetical protein A2W98_07620 [Bacteroidetes bacterium GWF2_33_38]OFY76547.1 MAG: hypothetical protein A2265_11005 [Bacteroidetes bacterium RIFOXYA12_FULL_33_9]OFY87521.1 MAG: hypothetical protein A2236_06560 [Bacteroidetes bacterium RIFOXYA2_FULL_33_7]HBF87268.1 hypothetical protein [Bacteroidales bacterium]
MKINLITTTSIILLSLSFGCDSIVDVKNSEIKNNIYTNNYFNFSLHFSNNWRVKTEKENAELIENVVVIYFVNRIENNIFDNINAAKKYLQNLKN